MKQNKLSNLLMMGFLIISVVSPLAQMKRKLSITKKETMKRHWRSYA